MRFCGIVLSALLSGSLASFAVADCRSIPGASAIEDGTWLFRMNGSWQPIDALGASVADGRPRAVNFAYVVRETPSPVPRQGMLVVKVGVEGPDAKERGRVALARDSFERTDQCGPTAPFEGDRRVNGRSYDRYHDYGYNVGGEDQGALDSFHVAYPARSGACRRSNDGTADSYFGGRWQSNRSQFSFDPNVVQYGQYSQFLAQFGVGPAIAETATERRVEMKRYAADATTGLACTLFRVALTPGTFIRINDLERRRDSIIRAPEQSWEWPR